VNTKMIALASAALAMPATAAPLEFGRKDAASPAHEVSPAEFKELAEQVKGALGEVQDFATKAAEALRKGEELTAEQKTKVDEALTKLNGFEALAEQVAELEQKAARAGARPEQPKARATSSSRMRASRRSSPTRARASASGSMLRRSSAR
jgi:peptidoglycan hydrolase CwlO-like protein